MAFNRRKCNKRNLRKITFRGKVTKVIYSLCYFQIDGNINVFSGEGFLVDNDEAHLPLLNETVLLKNVLSYDRRTLILTDDSKIISSNTRDESHLELMNNFKLFLLEYDLTPNDYRKMISMHENLNDLQLEIVKDNVRYSEINTASLLLDLLRDTIANTPENELTSLFDMKIKQPRDFQTKREIRELFIPHYIYWYAGFYRSEPKEILLGILNISNKSGFLMISGAAFELPVVVAQNDRNFSAKIQLLLNQFVAVNNYIQITEYYKDVGSIKYIYVDIDDVNPIEVTKNMIVMNATENIFAVNNSRSLFEMKFFVISKSSIIQKDNRRYFYMHVKYKFETDAKKVVLKECMFQVIEELLHLYPVFNDCDTYIVYTNSKEFQRRIIRQDSDSVFTISGDRLQSYNLPVDLKLKLIKEKDEQFPITEEDKLNILTVEEAKEFLKTTETIPNRKLVHVEGIVANRRFFPPYKENSSKDKVEPFGISGEKVHNIILRNEAKFEETLEPFEYVVYENDDCFEEEVNEYFEGTFPKILARNKKQIEVSVFLHNFDNLQYPLALVPEMKVIFKYVTAEKGKYFKPTVFSSVEVISYEPEVMFNSANVDLDSRNWGRQTCLGGGNGIPTNVVCWSTSIQIKIIQLKIKFQCKTCRKDFEEGETDCCRQFDFFSKMSLTFLVRDAGGLCKVTTNDEEILRVLLNQEKKEWGLFRKCLKIVRKFSFSGNNAANNTDLNNAASSKNSESTNFLSSFMFMLQAWNEAQIHHIDLKCRKLENREAMTDHLPFWWGLEARRSFKPPNLLRENC